jgi:cytochrome P450
MPERPSSEPIHVRAAPAHPDPYPYYAGLVGRGFFWDASQGVWVAASAEAVAAVFDSPICLTRPATCPVPGAIAKTPQAQLLGRLVRMRDGPAQAALKSAIDAAMASLDPSMVATLAQAEAARLTDELEPQRDNARLTRFLAALSARSMGTLLGVPTSRLGDLERLVACYGLAAAAALTGVPQMSETIMEAGGAAARDLLALFTDLVTAEQDTLSTRVARAASAAGIADRAEVAANAAGLLLQAQGAIAALMGLTLLALARHPRERAQIAQGCASLEDFIQEVVRVDAGTQSTPRFVASDGIVAGQRVRAGDCIVVTIAAASRDPALNPDPDRFDMHRKDRRYFEFGRGVHACSGKAVALQIARTGVAALLALGLPHEGLEKTVTYRPSAHLRIPIFEA